MQSIIKICSIVLLGCILCINTATAQKMGHLSTEKIIAELPDFKSVESQLKTLESQLMQKLTDEENKIKKKLADAESRSESLSPADIKKIQTELAQDEQTYMANKRKYQQQMQQKEQDLTVPLLTKIKEAIKSVAQENGYQYIIDSNALLFSVESDDVTSLVKRKLGI